MAKHRALITAVVLALLTAGAWWAWDQRQRTKRAEWEAGLASARILEAVFNQTAVLEVATFRGRAQARSNDDGVFDSVQTTKAPFTVLYTIDLRRLAPADYRWNAREQIMTVRIPAVLVGQPSIDMTRAEIKQDGFWISRRAGQNLQRAGISRLSAVAKAEAEKPEYVAKAQEAARSDIERLIERPLVAAGHRDVRVIVTIPGETKPPVLTEEQWDVSRSIEEIYRDLSGS